VITPLGNRDHDAVERPITMLWNGRSRCRGTADHDALGRAITMPWNRRSRSAATRTQDDVAGRRYPLHPAELGSLTAFVDQPLVWLDNNRTERGIRGPVVGRRNHFGSKSVRGTEVLSDNYISPSATMTSPHPEQRR
jgi:hypothetical protein